VVDQHGSYQRPRLEKIQERGWGRKMKRLWRTLTNLAPSGGGGTIKDPNCQGEVEPGAEGTVKSSKDKTSKESMRGEKSW